MAERVGFIGLGVMGLSMARNIHRGGFPLVVWNRGAKPRETLAAEGVATAETPRELGEQCNILFLCVTNGTAVEQALFGPDGAMTGKTRPAIVVDCSTISPREAKGTAEKLKELDVEFLDVPVTGGDAGAKAGTLTMMVGGDEGTLNRIRHICATMGKNIVHVGPIGAGQLTKCVNQIACAIAIGAMSEALLFAEQSGLDVQKTFEIIRSGAAGSWALDNYGPRLLRGDLKPGFHAKNMLKDIRIVLSECEATNIPLPLTGLIRELYTALISTEGARADELGNHALIALYRRLAGGATAV